MATKRDIEGGDGGINKQKSYEGFFMLLCCGLKFCVFIINGIKWYSLWFKTGGRKKKM